MKFSNLLKPTVLLLRSCLPAMISLHFFTKSISNMFQADHAQQILVNDLDALPFLLQLLEHHMMAANGSPTSVPHWPSIRAILGLVSELVYPCLTATGSESLLMSHGQQHEIIESIYPVVLGHKHFSYNCSSEISLSDPQTGTC